MPQLFERTGGFVEMIIAETRCRSFSLVTDRLFHEEFGQGGENAHHDSEHIPKDKLMTAVICLDGPKPLDCKEEEAVYSIKCERNLHEYDQCVLHG